jgi:hypothetical protein
VGRRDEDDDEITQWVEDTTQPDEISITLPGLPLGFDEETDAGGTAWIRDPPRVPPAEAETQRLDVAEETLIHLRESLRQVLEQAEAKPPPAPTPAAALGRRPRAQLDPTHLTTTSSLAGLAAALLISAVVILTLVLVQLAR